MIRQTCAEASLKGKLLSGLDKARERRRLKKIRKRSLRTASGIQAEINRLKQKAALILVSSAKSADYTELIKRANSLTASGQLRRINDQINKWQKKLEGMEE